MTMPEILPALTFYTGDFHRAALQAAVEQREAIIPELLRELETAAADPVAHAAHEKRMLHVFATYLLAQFQEPRAYAPLVRLLNTPGDTPYDLFGESLSCDMHRIFASVYDGNPVPLQALIENEAVDEYTRAMGVEALVVMPKNGRMTRDEVALYFGALFREKLARKNSYVWDSLVGAVGDLPAPELMDEVRRAFDENVADITVASFEEIQEFMTNPEWRQKEFALITDAISAMEWWAA